MKKMLQNFGSISSILFAISNDFVIIWQKLRAQSGTLLWLAYCICGVEQCGQMVSYNQGRNEWGQAEGNSPSAESLQGCQKAPTMSQVFSSIEYICFRKTSGSNIGAPNLLFVPGAISPRYATGYNTIFYTYGVILYTCVCGRRRDFTQGGTCWLFQKFF